MNENNPINTPDENSNPIKKQKKLTGIFIVSRN